MGWIIAGFAMAVAVCALIGAWQAGDLRLYPFLLGAGSGALFALAIEFIA